MSKNIFGIIFLSILFIPIIILQYLYEAVGGIGITIILLGTVALIVWGLVNAENKRQETIKKRRDYLMVKYNHDADLVEDIMNNRVWQGQLSVELIDSLGNPVATDEKVLKTKKKEVWKYQHQGGNRYNLRITLDDDVVVGWDLKT